METGEKTERGQELASRGVADIGHTFEKMRRPAGFDVTLNAFKEMAEGTAPFFMLMVYGKTGNGKTRCCEATVIRLSERGIYARRNRWSDVVRGLRSHFNGGGYDPSGLREAYEMYFNRWRNVPYLILDDIGSGTSMGVWEWGELEDIVDYRYEHRLFTILTTNMDIKAFPERIISRFKDKSRARFIFNRAEDQRPFQEVGK